MTQTKLSRHQRAILRILGEETKEQFWGIPVTYLSWMVARKLERKPGDYIENRKEWRRKRREEETNRFHRGEIDRETFDVALYFLRDNPRKRDETLTEKLRAAFGRCLRRLENRGLITRISSIHYEERNDGAYWVRYVGGRTGRVALTSQGKSLAESWASS